MKTNQASYRNKTRGFNFPLPLKAKSGTVREAFPLAAISSDGRQGEHNTRNNLLSQEEQVVGGENLHPLHLPTYLTTCRATRPLLTLLCSHTSHTRPPP